MFEEGQYFTPVTTDDAGDVRVVLSSDHPGFADPDYRARRDAIAALAVNYHRGDPVPRADYTAEEDEVWAIASRELAVKHRTYAIREFLDGAAALQLPTDRVPQLEEVSALLAPLTGFRYLPAAGLVPLREFYSVLAGDLFYSTQYIRHHSVPLYTPEPDIIHEVVGHANTLASQRFATLYRLAGQAASRVRTQEALEFVSKVFWFSLEFGVCYEAGDLKTYGAGILSSFGEIEEFRHQDIRPLDLARMGTQTYDITHYQPILFAGASFTQVEDVVGGFFSDVDDDLASRLLAGTGR